MHFLHTLFLIEGSLGKTRYVHANHGTLCKSEKLAHCRSIPPGEVRLSS